MMYIFHILINSADTDEIPLFGSSLFAQVPVYYYWTNKIYQGNTGLCLPYFAQKKCLNRADNDQN